MEILTSEINALVNGSMEQKNMENLQNGSRIL
jgi:hypothetical protein